MSQIERRPGIACDTGDEYELESPDSAVDDLGLDAEGRDIYEQVKRELAEEEKSSVDANS